MEWIHSAKPIIHSMQWITPCHWVGKAGWGPAASVTRTVSREAVFRWALGTLPRAGRPQISAMLRSSSKVHRPLPHGHLRWLPWSFCRCLQMIHHQPWGTQAPKSRISKASRSWHMGNGGPVLSSVVWIYSERGLSKVYNSGIYLHCATEIKHFKICSWRSTNLQL